MPYDRLRVMIEAAARQIAEHAEELTALDQAIGDGDHGINMKRGFDAVAGKADEIADLPFGQALQKLGMTLVMSVGGASGPLYGSLFMAIGKASGEAPASIPEAAMALQAGIDAVKKRGKSDAGAKTMLDVLVPVQAALAGCDGDAVAAIRSAADKGLADTKDMRATKGRAAFLGERSIGHLDPGARSSCLLLHTVCDVLEAGT